MAQKEEIMITIIVAMGENRVIGKKGKLPWKHNKEDMALFKKTTFGNNCLMGRKTWESIPEGNRPLKNRLNVVLTSQSDYLKEIPGTI